VHGDSTRLEQVVVNLLNNAAKYTPAGGQLWIGLQQEADEAVLRVKDTGEGIAPEVLPRIFDLFTQAERSLDSSQGGLGIGLALVQTLVGMHRGRVEVFSALGHGSEFVVRLPVLLSWILPASPPVEKAESTRPCLRVLVVDDNADAAEALAMLLKVTGHKTRLAHTGLAALQEAEAFQPNVVLLDIGLPQLNGYEVARRMRQHPTLKNTVLVALTGYGQESDRQLSKEAGFDHHLVKPADFGNLKKILASVSEKPT
jgi:CheY-like chemotaxis protein